MTLRDWFAGMTFQGLLSCGHDTDCPKESFAKVSYLFAEAMMEARK